MVQETGREACCFFSLKRDGSSGEEKEGNSGREGGRSSISMKSFSSYAAAILEVHWKLIGPSNRNYRDRDFFLEEWRGIKSCTFRTSILGSFDTTTCFVIGRVPGE